jgi:signal transduction histidine kinase
MGLYVAHVPVELPGRGTGVLDVTYVPEREELTIDRIRPWMLALAIAATIVAWALMQVSTGWVLGLVDDLREAADSVDEDRLDFRLPDLGHHEIGDLARSLNALIDRLRRRADAQTRFVADASHELATPVAGIRGYINILRDWGAEDPALRHEAIAAIDRESSRMARLCSDLLSLIRRERFTEMRVRRTDVNQLAREVLAGAATRNIDRGVDFVGPEEGPLTLYTDPDRLTQLLGVLVDNAAKYTSPGGSVTVRTWRRLERIVLEVADTGIGIPAEDLPHIFERFYRSDVSRSPDTGGFGIGLSIAARVTELMGGKIRVESTEGVGTTFSIDLPRRPEPVGPEPSSL